MSDRPPLSLNTERGALAAEIALGLAPPGAGGGDPRIEAEAMVWADRFAALAEEVEPAVPPARVYRRIEEAVLGSAAPGLAARVAIDPQRRRLVQRLGFWQALSGLSAAAAAGAIVLAFMPEVLPAALQIARTQPARAPAPQVAAAPELPAPELPPAPVGPRLVAAVGAGQGAPANFVATYDPRAHQILLVPAAGLRDVPRGRVLELWLVPPGGGAPVLLGGIDPSRPHTVDIPERYVPHAQTGAGLRVMLEPRGAQPPAAPRVLAHGTFSAL